CSLVSTIFFSSRRRHTRWPRDWSSDVCSSDLLRHPQPTNAVERREHYLPGRVTRFALRWRLLGVGLGLRGRRPGPLAWTRRLRRSEERRVGKECRAGWLAEDCRKKGSGC